MIYDEDFLRRLDLTTNKVIQAKVTSLSLDELPVEEITGRVTDGSISIDGTSAVRRTFNLSMIADTATYTDYYWTLKTKIKVELGVVNTIDDSYPEIIWFPQGIYYITQFSASRSINSCSISISGKDKMAQLNGDLGGTFTAETILDNLQEDSNYFELDGGGTEDESDDFGLRLDQFIKSCELVQLESKNDLELDKYGYFNIRKYLQFVAVDNDNGYYEDTEIKQLFSAKNVTLFEYDQTLKAYVVATSYKKNTIYYQLVTNDFSKILKEEKDNGGKNFWSSYWDHDRNGSSTGFSFPCLVYRQNKYYTAHKVNSNSVEHYYNLGKLYYISDDDKYKLVTEEIKEKNDKDYYTFSLADLSFFRSSSDEDDEGNKFTRSMANGIAYNLATRSDALKWIRVRFKDEEEKVEENANRVWEETRSDNSTDYWYLKEGWYNELLKGTNTTPKRIRFLPQPSADDENQYGDTIRPRNKGKLFYVKQLDTKETKIPIKQIITEMIHEFGREPYYNIVLDDLPDYGKEVITYIGEEPLFLLRKNDSGNGIEVSNTTTTIQLVDNDDEVYVKYTDLIKYDDVDTQVKFKDKITDEIKTWLKDENEGFFGKNGVIETARKAAIDETENNIWLKNWREKMEALKKPLIEYMGEKRYDVKGVDKEGLEIDKIDLPSGVDGKIQLPAGLRWPNKAARAALGSGQGARGAYNQAKANYNAVKTVVNTYKKNYGITKLEQDLANAKSKKTSKWSTYKNYRDLVDEYQEYIKVEKKKKKKKQNENSLKTWQSKVDYYKPLKTTAWKEYQVAKTKKEEAEDEYNKTIKTKAEVVLNGETKKLNLTQLEDELKKAETAFNEAETNSKAAKKAYWDAKDLYDNAEESAEKNKSTEAEKKELQKNYVLSAIKQAIQETTLFDKTEFTTTFEKRTLTSARLEAIQKTLFNTQDKSTTVLFGVEYEKNCAGLVKFLYGKYTDSNVNSFLALNGGFQTFYTGLKAKMEFAQNARFNYDTIMGSTGSQNIYYLNNSNSYTKSTTYNPYKQYYRKLNSNNILKVKLTEKELESKSPWYFLLDNLAEDTFLTQWEAQDDKPSFKVTLKSGTSWTGQFFKVEQDSICGYRQTDLIYSDDLICSLGNNVTNALDKIKSMLGEYEYFYDLDGRFRFRQRRTYLNNPFSYLEIDKENKKYSINYFKSKYMYNLSNYTQIINVSYQPQLDQLKNDFSLWGERTSIDGSTIPIHMRYAIDTKPTRYESVTKNDARRIFTIYGLKNYCKHFDDEENNWTERTDRAYKVYENSKGHFLYTNCDWRELLYQMASNFRRYGTYDPEKKDDYVSNFEFLLKERNPSLCDAFGKAGYEQYYADLLGFWRQLYNPFWSWEANENYEKKNFNTNTHWTKNLSNPELLNFWFDFLDSDNELEKFSVRHIGDRTYTKSESNWTSIKNKKIPEIVFTTSEEEDELDEEIVNVYPKVRIHNDTMKENISIATMGVDLDTACNDALYQKALINESLSLTTIPVYYLEPNTLLEFNVPDDFLNGDYIINRINYNLAYNATMSISMSKKQRYLD